MAESMRAKVADPAKERAEWRQLLVELVNEVEGWVQPEWATRVIEKEMHDPVLGDYLVPALLMQREFARILMEPITRFARGTEGVVDLYLMPAYDDIASIYRVDGEWKVHYVFPGGPVVAGIKNATSLPLTGEVLLRIMDGMTRHAS